MRRAAQILFVTVLVVAMCATAWAYTRPRWEVGPDIVHPRWPVDGTIVVFVNTEEDPKGEMIFATGSQPYEAVRNMFELRSAYTPLRFQIVSSTTPENMGFEGINLVTFKDTSVNRSMALGFTARTQFFWHYVDGEPTIVEADIVFNPAFDFTTTGSGGIDIESLGGHELIHFMCFDHSAVLASTAYPNFYTQVPNERNLALDDLAAGNFMYPFPDTPSRTGSLSGVIEKPGGVPVLGAHVVALGQADGRPVSDISFFGGEWRIDGLPPGQYTVYVEPLDEPAGPGDILDTGIYETLPADVVFETTFVSGNATPTVFNVAAGAETVVGVTEVSTTAGPFNVQNLGLSPSPIPVITQSAINVNQGWFAYLTLHGLKVDQVPDDGVRITGSGVDVAAAGIVRGFTQGFPYMVIPLSVDPTAPPGARTIFADNGTSISAITGGIEVHSSVPYPSLMRNDQLTSLASVATELANLLPLDPTGLDNFPGTGEGTLREAPGSDDDDNLYVPQIQSGYLDPDLAVLADVTRPMVLYQLDDPNRILFLGKDAGRVVLTYTDVP